MREDVALSTEILSHMEYIWDIVTRIRLQQASVEDLVKARRLKEALCVLLEEYEDNGYNYLLPSTMWLAKEICDSVEIVAALDLKDKFYA